MKTLALFALVPFYAFSAVECRPIPVGLENATHSSCNLIQTSKSEFGASYFPNDDKFLGCLTKLEKLNSRGFFGKYEGNGFITLPASGVAKFFLYMDGSEPKIYKISGPGPEYVFKDSKGNELALTIKQAQNKESHSADTNNKPCFPSPTGCKPAYEDKESRLDKISISKLDEASKNNLKDILGAYLQDTIKRVGEGNLSESDSLAASSCASFFKKKDDALSSKVKSYFNLATAKKAGHIIEAGGSVSSESSSSSGSQSSGR